MEKMDTNVKCANEACDDKAIELNLYCDSHACKAGELYGSAMDYYLDVHSDEMSDENFQAKLLMYTVYANESVARQVEYRSSPNYKSSYAYFNMHDLLFQSNWDKAYN